MIVWPDIIRALHDMVVYAAEIAPSRVVWARQPAPRKGGPYIDLSIAQVDGIGHPFLTEEDNPDSTLGDGRELIIKSRTARSMTLSIRCFGDPSGTQPEFILEHLVARSNLSIARGMMEAVGVGMAAWSPILPIDGFILNTTVFEPRAQTELRSFLASEVEDYGTFIESAEFQNQIDGTSFVVPPEGE